MKSEKSDYQLEVEAWVWRREADRRRLCDVVGVAFEPLEDESKGDAVNGGSKMVLPHIW